MQVLVNTPIHFGMNLEVKLPETLTARRIFTVSNNTKSVSIRYYSTKFRSFSGSFLQKVRLSTLIWFLCFELKHLLRLQLKHFRLNLALKLYPHP